MMESVKCPICLNAHGGMCKMNSRSTGDCIAYDCEVCGKYLLTGTVSEDYFLKDRAFTPLVRAALSHRIRNSQSSKPPMINSQSLEAFVKNPQIPSPSVQAVNIIKFIGDDVMKKGKPIEHLPVHFHATIGSLDRETVYGLLRELYNRGLVKGVDSVDDEIEEKILEDVTLTLDGWEKYEQEKQGKLEGKYGFVALKFENPKLNLLLSNHIKPHLKKEIGFEIIDMRDVAQAGVIDNIMRAKIRDATFILADLSDKNEGAYWEAGYAEGLGKPVIYLCHEGKFKEGLQTHFDVNHCTTVRWYDSDDKREHFLQELTATLRNTLNLFSS